MSTEPTKSDPRDSDLPFGLLEAGVFDFSAAALQEPDVPTGGLEIHQTIHVPTEIDFFHADSTGPSVALRITMHVKPVAEFGTCFREFVDLHQAMNDLDLELGGMGLVIDESLSTASNQLLIVVYRPRDVRWSQFRFEQAAALLGDSDDLKSLQESSIPFEKNPIVELIHKFNETERAMVESPRERIQSWRSHRAWLAGFQVEIIPSRAVKKGDTRT
jgi:hypothetical protein